MLIFAQPDEPSIKHDVRINIGGSHIAYVTCPGYLSMMEGSRSVKAYEKSISDKCDFIFPVIKNSLSKESDFKAEIDVFGELTTDIGLVNDSFCGIREFLVRRHLVAVWRRDDASFPISSTNRPEEVLTHWQFIKIADTLQSVGMANSESPNKEETKSIDSGLRDFFNNIDGEYPTIIHEIFLAEKFGWTFDYIRSLSARDVQGIMAYFNQRSMVETGAVEPQPVVKVDGRDAQIISLKDARKQVQESIEKRKKRSKK